MVNSDLPETSEFGQKQSALLDGPTQLIDAWVVGDAPVVAYEFDSTAAATFAKGPERPGHFKVPSRIGETPIGGPGGYPIMSGCLQSTS